MANDNGFVQRAASSVLGAMNPLGLGSAINFGQMASDTSNLLGSAYDTQASPTPTLGQPNLSPKQSLPQIQPPTDQGGQGGLTSETPVKDAITQAQQTFGLLNGGQYYINGAQVKAPSVNDVLNSAQDNAFASLQGTPGQSDLKNRANELINTYTSDINNVQNQLNAATTGENDLRTQTQNYYNTSGIDTATKQLQDAWTDLNNIKAQQLDNKFQLEDQYKGGGTEPFAQTLDERQQRLLNQRELAASIKYGAAQQALNTKIDVFKVFTDKAQQQQSQTIQQLSKQLDLDQTALSKGVDLLSIARQEERGNEDAARNLLLGMAQTFPGFFQTLTPADQQAFSQGKVTPSILAKLGDQVNIKQQKDQSQTFSTYLQHVSELANLKLLYPDSPQIDQMINEATQGALNVFQSTLPGGQTQNTFNPQTQGMRTDRNNNPTAMTTDVAKSLGLQEGIDYTQGDPFSTSTGATLYTAKLNGDPVQTTIKGLDTAAQSGKGAFQTASGKPRWSYINMTDQEWLSKTPEQKKQIVSQMYQREGGNGSLLGSNLSTGSTYSNDVKQTALGNQYIDLSQYQDAKQKTGVANWARANGVRVVNSDDLDQIRELDTTRQNINSMLSMAQSVLPSSGLDPSRLTNPMSSWFKVTQHGQDLASWNVFRNAAIQALRTVAGSKGLRINQAEIQTSIENDIPTITDPYNVAVAKAQRLATLMNNIESSVFANNNSK